MTGWKSISVSVGTLLVNGEQRLANYGYSKTGMPNGSIVTLPSPYRPKQMMMTICHSSGGMRVTLDATGVVTIYGSDGSGTGLFNFVYNY